MRDIHVKDDLIGRRLREPNGTAIGTIEYVGEVEGQTGIWYGVDWDDDKQGKHDGTHKNRRYFQARTPTSGSFLRASRLPSTSFGTTIMQACRDRYLTSVDTIAYDQCSFGNKQVEIVGMHQVAGKQNDLSTLVEVVLDGSTVDICGDPDELRSTLTSCTSLDLSNTLVNDAGQIAQIANVLTWVTTINASQLHLRDDSLDMSVACPTLTTLQLNRCDLDWSQVDRLIRAFTNLSTIGLCGNRIERIETAIPSSLTHVDLEANPIQSFGDVELLAKAENLKSLNLSRCNISTITLSFVGPSFVSLQELYLRECQIADYTTINTLSRRAPVLRRLVIARNPLTSGADADVVRQMVIARMHDNLEYLNRQIITPEERRGAQIDYIRACAQEYNKVEDNGEELKKFLVDHPNYDRFVKEYGAATTADIAAVTATGALSERMITLKIRTKVIGVDKSAGNEKKSFEKTIPRTLPISRLSTMIARERGLSSTHLKLHMSITNEVGEEYKYKMDNLSRTVEFYNLKTGDTIDANFHMYRAKK